MPVYRLSILTCLLDNIAATCHLTTVCHTMPLKLLLGLAGLWLAAIAVYCLFCCGNGLTKLLQEVRALRCELRMRLTPPHLRRIPPKNQTKSKPILVADLRVLGSEEEDEEAEVKPHGILLREGDYAVTNKSVTIQTQSES